mgnify:CR=1 FL=1
MKGIPERGNALETEPTLDDTSDYRFENLYRENRIEKRLDSQYPYLDLPFFRICDTFDIKSTKKPSCRRLRLVLLPSKGSYTPRAKAAALLLFAAKKYKSTPRLPQKRRLPKKPPENTQYYLIYGVVRNCIAASRSRGWRVPCRSTCPCANRRGTRRPPCSAG